MDKDSFSKGVKQLWDYRLEILAGILVLLGIILAFFYPHTGGALVGLGFGLIFFDEIHQYFMRLRDIYIEQGIIKSLILVGTIIYMLIAIPFFIIATAIGYAIIYLLRRLNKH